jgi:hypothetical protein
VADKRSLWMEYVDTAETVKWFNQGENNNAGLNGREVMVETDQEIKNRFFYSKRKRKMGGRLSVVKDKKMHMPKMPKQKQSCKTLRKTRKKQTFGS